MHCDDVTGFGAPDEEGAGLGIEVVRGQRCRGEVGRRLEASAVGILTPQGEHRAGIIVSTGSSPPKVKPYWSGVGVKRMESALMFGPFSLIVGIVIVSKNPGRW